MEITKLVEENKTLLRLGLCFDVPDARVRVTEHLQKNMDRSMYFSIFIFLDKFYWITLAFTLC